MLDALTRAMMRKMQRLQPVPSAGDRERACPANAAAGRDDRAPRDFPESAARRGVSSLISQRLAALGAVVAVAGCASPIPTLVRTDHPTVSAAGETEPAPGGHDAADDVADDPAIWVHPTRPGSSLLLGTGRDRGLHVYDLDGRERQFLETGRLKNVDLRMLPSGNGLAVASNLDTGAVDLFLVQVATRRVLPLPGSAVATGLDELRGVCLGTAGGERFHLFVNDQDGRYQHWLLERTGRNGFVSELARTFRTDGESAGCVVDEREQAVYVGEKTRGIWRGPLDAAAPWTPRLLDEAGGAYLVADVGGLAIYEGRAGSRYLIVSSQGDDSYAAYCLGDPPRHLASFRITAAAGIDGTSETDGLDATPAALGPRFPDGLLVVQDADDDRGSENFKLVDWRPIRQLIDEAGGAACRPTDG